ncbi:hypothetical protein GOV11_05300 [Candidatus Woesearchaeota archaeon]|nr:hypothetical protein [Candidatus Woesearchaeota archaeon]
MEESLDIKINMLYTDGTAFFTKGDDDILWQSRHGFEEAVSYVPKRVKGKNMNVLCEPGRSFESWKDAMNYAKALKAFDMMVYIGTRYASVSDEQEELLLSDSFDKYRSKAHEHKQVLKSVKGWEDVSRYLYMSIYEIAIETIEKQV